MSKQKSKARRLSRRQFVTHSGVLLGTALGLPFLEAVGSGATSRRGQIVAAVSERALTLDPADHYSISTTSMLRHVFDPLIDVTNDSKFVPALAESWEVVNNTTWRFTLRRGVTFHDGSPFNADSVVYTLKRIRDNTKLIKSFVYQALDAIEKEGDFAVKVTTKLPSARCRRI
jgi:peptide/nickel transport system substrate-binding protein